MTQKTHDALIELLEPNRLTSVVDIGANPFEGDPPYKRMLQHRMCRLIGFEPQPDALAHLQSSKGDLEHYLPYAVGDGGSGTLRICQASGMTSLFEPDENILLHFPKFSEWGRVVDQIQIATHRLDDIAEIDVIDYLKIDVQGSELSIFQNGHMRLKKTLVIQTEVLFLAMYKGQPLFGDIDLELRKLGFVPHMFVDINKRMITPMVSPNPFAAINQMLFADVVYVRDFTKAAEMDSEQLKHLAIISHHCYGSYDLAMNCICHLVGRNAVTADAQNRYLELLQNASHAKAKSA
ncbi:MAG TPA: FkbM family methyltransferase [Pseudolabrys sp.]|nr:FkbM family methyltransferase [Pseudolabrys sp.]